eukprot:1138474-Pelagomonas_calceolata.AAC.5
MPAKLPPQWRPPSPCATCPVRACTHVRVECMYVCVCLCACAIKQQKDPALHMHCKSRVNAHSTAKEV